MLLLAGGVQGRPARLGWVDKVWHLSPFSSAGAEVTDRMLAWPNHVCHKTGMSLRTSAWPHIHLVPVGKWIGVWRTQVPHVHCCTVARSPLQGQVVWHAGWGPWPGRKTGRQLLDGWPRSPIGRQRTDEALKLC